MRITKQNYESPTLTVKYYYDPESETGLRYTGDGKYMGRFKDKVAGHLQIGDDGYLSYRITHNEDNRRTSLVAARVVYFLKHGEIDPFMQIDHIDGNTLNNKIENLRLVCPNTNMKNKAKYKTNKTNVSGVNFFDNNTNRYFQARVYNQNKRRVCKYFSIEKLGEEQAFRLACEWRERMIQELNDQGAGYTERHGT